MPKELRVERATVKYPIDYTVDCVYEECVIEGVILESDGDRRVGPLTQEMADCVRTASAFLGFKPNDLSTTLDKAANAIESILKEGLEDAR